MANNVSISDSLTIEQAVQEAWAKVLPYIPFEPGLTWYETGIDSLKSMELALRVERALGVKVNFDLMAGEATVRAFVEGLALPAPADPPASATLFLIPGMYGDEPRLADFRTSLRGQVRIDTLRLPDIQDRTRLLCDLEATGRYVLEQIVAHQPEGDVYIAGFSFGAEAAHEAARQLEATGRRVALLCVLDGQLGVNPQLAAGLGPRRSVWERISFPDASGRRRIDWAVLLFVALMRLYAWGLARRLLLAVSRHRDPQWVYNRRARLLGELRGHAVRLWRPPPCQAETLIIASAEFPLHERHEEWAQICPNSRTASVGGAHLDLFKPPTLQAVNAALLQGLEQAGYPLPRQAAPADGDNRARWSARGHPFDRFARHPPRPPPAARSRTEGLLDASQRRTMAGVRPRRNRLRAEREPRLLQPGHQRAARWRTNGAAAALARSAGARALPPTLAQTPQREGGRRSRSADPPARRGTDRSAWRGWGLRFHARRRRAPACVGLSRTDGLAVGPSR